MTVTTSGTKIKQFILLAGDAVIFYFSLYLALWLRYLEKPTAEMWASHFWPFTAIFAVWLIIFYIARLYSLKLAVNNIRFIQLTLNSLIAAGVVSLAFFYLTPGIGIAPKTNLFIHIAVFTALFSFWRRLFNWLLKSYLPKSNIAFVGLSDGVKELIRELEQKPNLGYKVMFVAKDENGSENILGLPIFNFSDLPRQVAEKNVSTLVLASDPRQSEELRNALFACLALKINYVGFPNFYETVTGKIPLEAIGEMWFLENLSEGNKKFFDAAKRAYDFAFALAIFAATFIFWPLIALIIKLESKGPVFFRQARVGKNNKTFIMIKFRSMTEAGNDLSPTSVNDARVTRFGSFLRKTRIDEIPQMINILKGEMSFVGPRPERPGIAAELAKQIPFYRERALVKPGITGSDQISGEYHSPSVEDTIKKIQYDLFYIKNRSIYLDLSIILKTIATVLSRGGR